MSSSITPSSPALPMEENSQWKEYTVSAVPSTKSIAQTRKETRGTGTKQATTRKRSWDQRKDEDYTDTDSLSDPDSGSDLEYEPFKRSKKKPKKKPNKHARKSKHAGPDITFTEAPIHEEKNPAKPKAEVEWVVEVQELKEHAALRNEDEEVEDQNPEEPTAPRDESVEIQDPEPKSVHGNLFYEQVIEDQLIAGRGIEKAGDLTEAALAARSRGPNEHYLRLSMWVQPHFVPSVAEPILNHWQPPVLASESSQAEADGHAFRMLRHFNKYVSKRGGSRIQKAIWYEEWRSELIERPIYLSEGQESNDDAVSV